MSRPRRLHKENRLVDRIGWLRAAVFAEPTTYLDRKLDRRRSRRRFFGRPRYDPLQGATFCLPLSVL